MRVSRGRPCGVKVKGGRRRTLSVREFVFKPLILDALYRQHDNGCIYFYVGAFKNNAYKYT